jgi:hypothetical protein
VSADILHGGDRQTIIEGGMSGASPGGGYRRDSRYGGSFMKKAFVFALSCGLAALVMFGVAMSPALAIKAFKDQFESKYVKEKPANDKEKALAEAVAQAKCNVCHEGKKKKDRNAYGKELSKLLDKKVDKEDVKKIQKTLDQVAKLKVDPKDKKSPSFGQRISEGKLPVDLPKKEEEKK